MPTMLNLDTVPWAQANWMGVTWVGPRLASIAPAFVSSAKGMVKLCTGAQDYLRSNQQAPHVCMPLENPQHTSCCAAAAPHPLLPHDCFHTCSRPVAPPESIHRIHCTQTHTAAATARSQQPCQRDLKLAPTTANTACPSTVHATQAPGRNHELYALLCRAVSAQSATAAAASTRAVVVFVQTRNVARVATVIPP